MDCYWWWWSSSLTEDSNEASERASTAYDATANTFDGPGDKRLNWRCSRHARAQVAPEVVGRSRARRVLSPATATTNDEMFRGGGGGDALTLNVHKRRRLMVGQMRLGQAFGELSVHGTVVRLSMMPDAAW